jgi:hypothetical protein
MLRLLRFKREERGVVFARRAKLGSTHGTREVARGRLDLDDVGTEVPELHRAVRATHDLCEIDDAHAVEGKNHECNSRLHVGRAEGVRYVSRIRKRRLGAPPYTAGLLNRSISWPPFDVITRCDATLSAFVVISTNASPWAFASEEAARAPASRSLGPVSRGRPRTRCGPDSTAEGPSFPVANGRPMDPQNSPSHIHL